MNEVTLTAEQVAAAHAFIEAFHLNTTGVWVEVEAAMRDDFGIPNPEAALDDLLTALQS